MSAPGTLARWIAVSCALVWANGGVAQTASLNADPTDAPTLTVATLAPGVWLVADDAPVLEEVVRRVSGELIAADLEVTANSVDTFAALFVGLSSAGEPVFDVYLAQDEGSGRRLALSDETSVATASVLVAEYLRASYAALASGERAESFLYGSTPIEQTRPREMNPTDASVVAVGDPSGVTEGEARAPDRRPPFGHVVLGIGGLARQEDAHRAYGASVRAGVVSAAVDAGLRLDLPRPATVRVVDAGEIAIDQVQLTVDGTYRVQTAWGVVGPAVSLGALHTHAEGSPTRGVAGHETQFWTTQLAAGIRTEVPLLPGISLRARLDAGTAIVPIALRVLDDHPLTIGAPSLTLGVGVTWIPGRSG